MKQNDMKMSTKVTVEMILSVRIVKFSMWSGCKDMLSFIYKTTDSICTENCCHIHNKPNCKNVHSQLMHASESPWVIICLKFPVQTAIQ